MKRRLRPLRAVGSTICWELFALDDLFKQRRAALAHLRAAWSTTVNRDVHPRDAKIYKREVDRRRRDLHHLQDRRKSMMVLYAEELLNAQARHPDLSKHFAALRTA